MQKKGMTTRLLTMLHPSGLSTQMILPIAVIILVTLISGAYYSIEQKTQHEIEQHTEQAQALADQLVHINGLISASENAKNISAILQQTSQLPHVRQIAITQPAGEIVIGTDKNLTAPNLSTPPLHTEGTTHHDASLLTVWRPLTEGKHSNWLKITYNIQHIQEFKQHTWTQVLILALGLIFVSSVFILLFLSYSLNAVERFTFFANHLEDYKGEPLVLEGHCSELEQLGDALNKASQRLIQQQSEIESALKNAERIAAMPESNPNICLSIDTEHNITYINPAGRNLLQILGCIRLEDVFHILPHTLNDIVDACCNYDKPVKNVESEYKGRAFIWNFAPISTQNVVHCFAVDATDIKHAQKRAQEALIEKISAERANRAKTYFLANMSHEMRTPLNSIIGFSETLKSHASSSKEKDESVETILRSSRHLLSIINDILDLSKIEAGKLEVEKTKTSPFQIVKDINMIIGPQAERKGLGFNLEYTFPLPEYIYSDPVRIKQILLNLCSNAIKFTKKGLVRVRIYHTTENNKLHIDVMDSGIGLTRDQIDKVFKAFQQADASTTRQYGGTGLGLYLSKQFAERLGGTIRTQSVVNLGSTFSLEVDTGDISYYRMLHSEDQVRYQANNDAVPTTEQYSAHGVNILVVDDNPDNQRLISVLLKKAGAIITLANNGAEAVETALTNEFEIVLMDMQMPIMDGLEATRMLRQKGYDRPIIALTANAMLEDRKKCEEAGCDSFLTKPINKKQLFDIINHHCIADTVENTA